MWAISRPLLESGLGAGADFHATRTDERVQVARSDADMPTELGVSDTPLKDQPAYEPRRRAQPVSGLLNGQRPCPTLQSCFCYTAVMVMVSSSSLAIRRSSGARAAAEEQLGQVRREKQAAIDAEDFERAAGLRDKDLSFWRG
jgi:hypothetical protein